MKDLLPSGLLSAFSLHDQTTTVELNSMKTLLEPSLIRLNAQAEIKLRTTNVFLGVTTAV
jgi:hypothetical protein